MFHGLPDIQCFPVMLYSFFSFYFFFVCVYFLFASNFFQCIGNLSFLYLERVLWESKVWIDGRFIDTQEGLGTPHYHRLGTLNPGKHRIAIRINNDMIYNIGDKGHSYSAGEDTIIRTDCASSIAGFIKSSG